MQKEKIIELKNLIDEEEKINSVISVKRERFEEEYKELFLSQAKTREAICDLKEKLSDEAKIEFKQSGEKKLLGGIGIRIGTKLIYEVPRALQWALDHKLCLSLDKKAFEQLAKTQFIDFVDKEEKVTVTFPKEIKLEG